VLRYKIKMQVEVLDLDDVKKEYYIVDARLKISKINSDMHIVAHTGNRLFCFINFYKENTNNFVET